MRLSDLTGQDLSVRVLGTHIEKDRLAHTYLLTGGGLDAQKKLVSAFAADLFTQTGETAPEIIQKKLNEGNHPDFKWMGEDESQKNLKIDQVRDMIGWSMMRPYEAAWKIFAVASAERLTVDAQNALLKTLEEPPAKTVYFMLVENRANLLDTIRSRAFELRLNPPAEAVETKAEDIEVPEGFGRKKWEDFFEEYQGLSKQELQVFLESLAAYFRHLMRSSSYRQEMFDAWLAVQDSLYESQAALDSNANQKLVMTRLAVKFKKHLPSPQRLEPCGR